MKRHDFEAINKELDVQEINVCRLENYIEKKLAPFWVVVGEPCEKLLKLQEKGYCVLAELKHMQGLSDEEIAEALFEEKAVMQYVNVCIDAEKLPQAYLRRIWCRHVDEPVLIAETERLMIRESIAEDAEAFYELYQDIACQKYLESLPVELNGEHDYDIAAYRRYIAQYQAGQYAFYEYGMWSVLEKESGRCIGRAGVELQKLEHNRAAVPNDEAMEVLGLGYALLQEHRGKGYAVEACLAILEYCKECEYTDKVYVKIDEGNIASRKVFEKLEKQSPIELKRNKK